MKIAKVLIIGSGALKIGEAGEFDYSGTQALKALKEENIFTILINPNIATVQTSEKIADKIYFLPITTNFVEKIIKKEKPQGILLAFGGQTALNCGIDLFKKGIIKKYNLKVLGTSIESIIDSEDRDIFRLKLNKINIHTAKSIAVTSLEKALEAVKKIGFPVIIRSAYALGGLGSGFAKNLDELKNLVSKSLSYTDQILIEESLQGWKEIEYEIVRDNFNNCIAVCNMENFDPIGIHTGESIVVAPSQTLTNYEYHKLRTISINIARYFKIIGECNVQFALSPNSSEYRVIEINARLSRSSALASKATGYPLAFIAAKISIGYGLHELKNVVNKTTSAFFEPALDYVVCKLPRWDLKKFYGVSDKIGSSMKSIGEVMAIGGSFEEAFQKGIRMLDIGLKGFINNTYKYEKKYFNNIKKFLKEPTDERIKFLELAFEQKYTVKEIHNLTKIDIWFLYKLENIYKTKKILESYKNWIDIPDKYLWKAKKQGFSDEQILGFYIKDSEIFSHIQVFKKMRKSKGILPYTRQIDTLAAEYPSYTNYLYLTYHSSQHDISYKNDKKSIIVLGSGVYRIGSSVEFDWCCVNSLQTIQKLGYRAVMINYNPETVSTDFDVCDRLYFEELNIERILDIIELENPKGVIISMGGQIPNNLALKLYNLGVPILGTSPISIDNVENRYKFSQALDLLKINQPRWQELTDYKSINKFIQEVGYPILVRPSYVLSGAAMNVVFNSKDLEKYLKEAINISPTYPVVVTKFIDNAKEIEFDAVACNGKIVFYAISEHIEFAGVHSGDATLIYPTQNIYLSTLNMIYIASEKIAKYFNISGPFNIQFLSKKNKLQVIECNLRASRSFPFISKISRFNMIDLATKVLLNDSLTIKNKNIAIKHIGIKASQFSFSRLQGADPILRVDMTSTGEVGCIGYNFNDVIIKAMLSVGYNIPKKNILISGYTIHSNFNLIKIVKLLYEHGYKIYTTQNIYKLLLKYDINSICLYYTNDNQLPKVLDFIKNKKIDLIINLHKNTYKSDHDNDYYIRRTAIDFNVPLLTNARLAKVFIKAFCKMTYDQLDISDWNSYFNI